MWKWWQTNHSQLRNWSGSLNSEKVLMILWISKICGAFWGFYSWPLTLILFLAATEICCAEYSFSCSEADSWGYSVVQCSLSAEMASAVGLLSTTSEQTLFFFVLNRAATVPMLHDISSSLSSCDLFFFFLYSDQANRRDNYRENG